MLFLLPTERKFGKLFFLLPFYCFSVSAQENISPLTDSLKKDAIHVFIDCNGCDLDFFRKEITFVNYVRERKEAHLHILLTSQPTASGGRAYSFLFIGQKNFSGINDTLIYNSDFNATEDEIRNGQVNTLKLGMVRYVSKTPLAERLRITMTQPPSAENIKDKWNNWVFTMDASGFFNGQQSQKMLSSWSSAYANKTTEEWKIEFSISNNYRESIFQIDDSTEIRAINRSNYFNHLLVKSISNHWSAGGFARAENSDFSNIKLSYSLSPAIEYNVFPYSEATRRQWRMLYTAGYWYFYYTDTTIYNKTEEGLWRHRLSAAFEIKQTWGSVSVSVSGAQYLHDAKLYNVYFRPWFNLRVFKGFNLRLGGNVSLIRDQIALPKKGATLEEILLQQRQLATQYSFWGNFGISYTFGSIYSNVVNPRFDN